MIPASRRRIKKNRLQQARQRRGLDWEKALAADLNEEGWARCWPAGWGGQPWDISAVLEGYAYAIECKHIARGTCPDMRTPEASAWWPCCGMNRKPCALCHGLPFGTPCWAAAEEA